MLQGIRPAFKFNVVIVSIYLIKRGENMFKKIITAVLATLMLLIVLPTKVLAEETENNITDEYKYTDLDGKTHQYYDVHGNPLKISEVEILMQPKLVSLEIQPTRVPIYPEADVVLVNSYYETTGTRKQITPTIAGPATLTYGQSVSESSSISVNFGAEINSRIFRALALRFGVTFTHTSSSNERFDAAFPIPAGKKGAVFFTPQFYSGYCTYVDTNYQGTGTYVSFPKMNGVYTAGLYELITW